jgi:hypothetical protein
MAVVKSTWKVDTAALDNLNHFATSFNSMSFSLFEQVSAEIAPPLLNELQHYPPVPPGSKYIRTFRLRDGWRVDIGAAGDGKFRFEVSNNVDYTVWVVGSLATAREAAARFQRDFHRAHGWFLATDTVTFWFNAFMDEYQERFDAQLASFGITTGGRRARTR